MQLQAQIADSQSSAASKDATITMLNDAVIQLTAQVDVANTEINRLLSEAAALQA